MVVIVGEDVNGDGVYCQLYSGWRQGEWSPGGRSCGISVVEAPGDGIKVGSVGFGEGEGISAGEVYYASVIAFDPKTFGEEAVGLREGGGDDVGESSGDVGC